MDELVVDIFMLQPVCFGASLHVNQHRSKNVRAVKYAHELAEKRSNKFRENEFRKSVKLHTGAVTFSTYVRNLPAVYLPIYESV